MAGPDEMPDEKVATTALEQSMSASKELHNNAQIATDREKALGFLQAIRLYPTAAGWSVYFSLGILMAAFDPQVVGNLFATGAFQKDFGYKFEDGYIISAPWQTGLMMGSPIGQVVGALFAG